MENNSDNILEFESNKQKMLMGECISKVISTPGFTRTLTKYPLYPHDVAQRFEDSAKDLKTGELLRSLCLVAAISNRRGLENYIRTQIQKENSREFLTVLNSLKEEWMSSRGKRWFMGKLNLAGHCILETGYKSDIQMVRDYVKKIGAKSHFSANLDIERVPKKFRKSVTDRRLMFNEDHVREGGEIIMNHMEKLQKGETKV